MATTALFVFGAKSPLVHHDSSQPTEVFQIDDPSRTTTTGVPFDPYAVRLIQNNPFTVNALVDYTLFSVTDVGETKPVVNCEIQNVISFSCTKDDTFLVRKDRMLYRIFYENRNPIRVDPVFAPVKVDLVWCSPGDNVFVYSRTDNQLYAKGMNKYGELGLKNTAEQTSFQLVPGVPSVGSLQAGASHTFLTTKDHRYFFAGRNAERQCLNVDFPTLPWFTEDTISMRDCSYVYVCDNVTLFAVNNGETDRLMMKGRWRDGQQWPAEGVVVPLLEAIECTSSFCVYICASRSDPEFHELCVLDSSANNTVLMPRIDVSDIVLPLHSGFETVFIITDTEEEDFEDAVEHANQEQKSYLQRVGLMQAKPTFAPAAAQLLWH